MPVEVGVLEGRDDVADDAGELHGLSLLTWMVSTMPTMAASTGQSFSPTPCAPSCR